MLPHVDVGYFSWNVRYCWIGFVVVGGNSNFIVFELEFFQNCLHVVCTEVDVLRVGQEGTRQLHMHAKSHF